MNDKLVLDDLLERTVRMGGSDLHISVGCPPRVRQYGELKDLSSVIIKPSDARDLLVPLLDAYARGVIQSKGSFDLSYNIPKVSRFRVNIFKQKGDYSGVFRVLPEKVPDYSKLGLPNSLYSLTRKRRGLVLIVGPTGSGKTTTLASFIETINSNYSKHIVSLEDPIEYVHWSSKSVVNQREIGSDCDTFANGLRAALRQDPDIIFIGEMRDLETTDIALTSAETGHLVCSTLHTLGTTDTINRVIDMYPESQHRQVRSMLSGVLISVVSQQLLPKKDGSGYIAAFEIMFVDKVIKDMIRRGDIEGLDTYVKSKEAYNSGMISMDDSIINLYKKGLITRDVALDYAFDSKSMMTKI